MSQPLKSLQLEEREDRVKFLNDQGLSFPSDLDEITLGATVMFVRHSQKMNDGTLSESDRIIAQKSLDEIQNHNKTAEKIRREIG